MGNSPASRTAQNGRKIPAEAGAIPLDRSVAGAGTDANTDTGTSTDTGIVRPLTIGGVQWRNNVLLAPMSGVSDVPFRRAAWRCGAGMVFSEMVASEALVTGHMEMRMKAESAGLPFHVVQLAGRQAKWMDHAARLAEANGADMIDINMGCPARKVTNGLSGSALMRDLDHAMTLVEAVTGAVKLPVTLKMRLGWDHTSINAPELARRAVDAGVKMITVHGRTRCQFYKGRADWHAVRAVCDAVRVPLIVNGDIGCAQTAHAAMAASGADGVMLGRACYGQPNLPGDLSRELSGEVLSSEHCYSIVEHYRDIIAFYGEPLGLRCARKHAGWWMERLPFAVAGGVKREIMTSRSAALVEDRLAALERELYSGVLPGTGKRVA